MVERINRLVLYEFYKHLYVFQSGKEKQKNTPTQLRVRVSKLHHKSSQHTK